MHFDLTGLLELLVRENGSDIVLISGELPRLKTKRGDVLPLPQTEPLTDADIESALQEVAGEGALEHFREHKEYEIGFTREHLGRFRATFFVTLAGLALAIRYVPFLIPRPEELGIPRVLQDLALMPDGLILVTGPNGHGKSTTLASLIEHINQHRDVHIVTIEDPIEFVFHSKRAAFSQREVGHHTLSFGTAIRHTLRQAVDVIVVGEMRDLATISAALTLAETGHLVLATLHTQDAPRTVERIIDVFPAEQQGQVALQLANSLTAVVSQRLIPRADGNGRIAARELLIANDGVRHAIRVQRLSEMVSQMQINRQAGMITFDDHLVELVQGGLITREQAIFHAHDRVTLARQIG